MTEYPWWEPYKFAVLETDRKKLKDRVIAAEQAIRARALLDGQVSGDERLAIRDAMSALQMLRRQSEHDVISLASSIQTRAVAMMMPSVVEGLSLNFPRPESRFISFRASSCPSRDNSLQSFGYSNQIDGPVR